MDLSNLDITMSKIRSIEYRVASIDRRFNALLGNEEKGVKSFSNILDKKINKNDQQEVKEAEKNTDINKVSSKTDKVNKEEISKIVEKYSKQYDIDKELINAVIQTESGYDQNAKSPVGALGLMQLMPSTAQSLGVVNPYNPEENIAGGTKYLSNLIDRYNSVELGLAAYNAGPGNVNKYGGIPPYKETQNYVKKVMKLQQPVTD